MSLDDLYKETILDHYQSPRNRGQLADPDVATRGHNPLCGDEVLLSLKVDGDVIQDIAFSGRGCSISQASASMMTDSVKGGSLGAADTLTAGFKEMMAGSGSTDGLTPPAAAGAVASPALRTTAPARASENQTSGSSKKPL